jgi:hypothetical protein
MFIEPSFAASLEFRKIDYSPDTVLRIAGNKKVGDVIMSVEMLTLPTMLEQTVSGTKFDSPHDH